MPKNPSRRSIWLKAMRLEGLELKKQTMFVCPLHFKDSDYYTDYELDPTCRKRKDLKRDAIPSIFPWNQDNASKVFEFVALQDTTSKSDTGSEKENLDPMDPLVTLFNDPVIFSPQQRTSPSTENQSTSQSSELEAEHDILFSFNPTGLKKTYSNLYLPTKFAPELPCLPTEPEAIDPLCEEEIIENVEYFAETDIEVGNDIEIVESSHIKEEECFSDAENGIKQEDIVSAESTDFCQSCGQSQIPSYSIHSLKSHPNPNAVHFYTGLETFDKLMFVFNSLGPSVNNLNYFYGKPPDHLDPLEKFCMTLIILRRHREFEDLAMTYKTSIKQVTNIFVTWLRFISLQWRTIDIWINRDAVSYYMPLDFADKYPNTRVILDATECPIKKPHLPTTQQITFSTYKNRNTIKFVVGIAPSGLITYTSPCYGGSASDRQIIERSSILNNLQYNDELMVDKGFNVQDIFLSHGVKVNMPAFFKKSNQINPDTLSRDRKIASKRVHIERVIGMLKTFKILTQPMNKTETLLASDITFVVAMLVNFRSNIINKNA